MTVIITFFFSKRIFLLFEVCKSSIFSSFYLSIVMDNNMNNNNIKFFPLISYKKVDNRQNYKRVKMIKGRVRKKERFNPYITYYQQFIFLFNKKKIELWF
jgi:hypothetical protein